MEQPVTKTQPTPQYILVCDDTKGVLAGIRYTVEEQFPQYTCITTHTIDGALKEARRVNGSLRLVSLDGDLMDEQGRWGWDVARELRSDPGFRGKIIYGGKTPLPPGQEALFDRVVPVKQLDGPWVNDFREYLA